MTKPIIAIYIPIKKEHITEVEALAPEYDVQLAENLDQADYKNIEIIYGWDKSFTEADFKEMPNLKWIQKDSAGLDSVPDSVLNDSKILVSNMSGIHARSIAENVFGYLLATARGLFITRPSQSQHQWERPDPRRLTSLKDKSLMIYGTGNIGSEIAEIAHIFDMTVIGVNTNGRSIQHFDETYSFEEAIKIVSKADVVVNAMPLTKVNHHYYDKEWFNEMASHGLFINIGRGESVVEEDLYQALEQEAIAGAYSDVFAQEPLKEDSPLWEAKNLIITPHISGSVEHFREATYAIFSKNLKQYLKDGTLAINQYNSKKEY